MIAIEKKTFLGIAVLFLLLLGAISVVGDNFTFFTNTTTELFCMNTTGNVSNECVNGSTLFNTQIIPASTDTCNATIRGKMRLNLGGAGVADELQACVKNVSDAYAWTMII